MAVGNDLAGEVNLKYCKKVLKEVVGKGRDVEKRIGVGFG